MQRKEQLFEAKLEGLRIAIDEGDASGVAEGDVFARVRDSIGKKRSRIESAAGAKVAAEQLA